MKRYCLGGSMKNSQRKKDVEESRLKHLETRSKVGEEIIPRGMPMDVDNHADIVKYGKHNI